MIKLLTAVAIGCLLATNVAEARTCKVSHYGVGDGYHGRTAANGSKFNAYGMTAAHPSRKFGSKCSVSYKGKSITVTITDRGPFAGGRCLDLSYGAFSKLTSPSRGVIAASTNC